MQRAELRRRRRREPRKDGPCHRSFDRDLGTDPFRVADLGAQRQLRYVQRGKANNVLIRELSQTTMR